MKSSENWHHFDRPPQAKHGHILVFPKMKCGAKKYGSALKGLIVKAFPVLEL
jgi:hypothetical protein